VTDPRAAELMVSFAGDGAGEGPLTWAQSDHWRGIVRSGQAATLSGAYPMPPGTTVAEVAGMLRFIMSRHQALRTRLRVAGDQARQVCAASGEIPLLLLDAGPEDPAAVAERLRDRLSSRPFDYQQDWPVRMAAVTAAGAVSHFVLSYLHLAVDTGGLLALQADLDARDPVTGAPAGPVQAIQPLELARRLASPAGQRQSAASLRHLEQALRTVQPALLGAPRPGPPVYRAVRYRSPATALALRRIADEQRVPAPSALLALFAVSLARYLGTDSVWTMVLVNNRFRPGLADSVSQLVQSSPFQLELAGTSLATALAAAQQGLLSTYKTAYYDSYRQDEVIERVERERGAAVLLLQRPPERPVRGRPGGRRWPGRSMGGRAGVGQLAGRAGRAAAGRPTVRQRRPPAGRLGVPGVLRHPLPRPGRGAADSAGHRAGGRAGRAEPGRARDGPGPRPLGLRSPGWCSRSR
jgi:hypothetical protein